ncbi:myeloid cell surface antigen CD33-like isoform X2 [Xiphias gladius]|uniref:myeloid cell surface antigen CD33-like isoform X2 n=1 Tax=Xiphias gladius TaxID=8245 RepID=UPI001A990009|nr:myeloid cell surface antigen CD33-like isoform X2 [Xiphias gladius]
MDKEGNMKIFCLLLAATCSPVFSEEWKATVVKSLDALVTSCVVVPCSFTHPKENLPSSRLRGIWHRSNNKNELIYYEDQTRVLENFRGRTRLLGKLGQNNCTLEMTEIKNHDNGPFCFRIELARTETDTSTKDKFSFVEDCVALNMLADPPMPELRHAKTATEGRPYIVTCSVTHTCSSHVPKLTWSRSTTDGVTEVHREIHSGNWELQSIMTFIPEEKDDHSEVTCTATFNGEKTSSATLKLYLKRTGNYNHIIIPAVVGIGTAMIFGVFCIFMVKKYKRRIAELQSPDGSMWNRLSRMSRRIRSGGSGPSHADQRRPQVNLMEFGHTPNNVNLQSCAHQKISKPHFPSPKSQPKSFSYKEDLDSGDDYINTADLNIYGNL